MYDDKAGECLDLERQYLLQNKNNLEIWMKNRRLSENELDKYSHRAIIYPGYLCIYFIFTH